MTGFGSIRGKSDHGGGWRTVSDDMVFAVAAKCFAPIAEEDWNALTTGACWSDFLDAARRLLQSGALLGASEVPAHGARLCCPLQDFLSVGEVDALFAPPSWQRKRRFEACHFTGGLPVSAVPVESLYRGPGSLAAPVPAPGSGALPRIRLDAGAPRSYNGDSARYMRDLVQRMGLRVPQAFEAYPDHLALELDLAAALLRGWSVRIARLFLVERLSWLSAYRLRLIEIMPDDAVAFYIGLVDVLLGIWLQLGAAPSARSGASGSQIVKSHQSVCL